MSKGIEVRVGDHVEINPHGITLLIGMVSEIPNNPWRVSDRDFGRGNSNTRVINHYKPADIRESSSISREIEYQIREHQTHGSIFRIVDIVHDDRGHMFAIPDFDMFTFPEAIKRDFRRRYGGSSPIKLGLEFHNLRVVARDAYYSKVMEPPSLSMWEKANVDAILSGNKVHKELEDSIKENPVKKESIPIPEHDGAGVKIIKCIIPNTNMNHKDFNKIDLGIKVDYKPINIEFKDEITRK